MVNVRGCTSTGGTMRQSDQENSTRPSTCGRPWLRAGVRHSLPFEDLVHDEAKDHEHEDDQHLWHRHLCRCACRRVCRRVRRHGFICRRSLYIGSVSAPYRLCINPNGALYRLCIGPNGAAYRLYIGSVSNLTGLYIGSVSTLTGSISALYRLYIGSISATYGDVECDGQRLHQFEHLVLERRLVAAETTPAMRAASAASRCGSANEKGAITI